MKVTPARTAKYVTNCYPVKVLILRARKRTHDTYTGAKGTNIYLENRRAFHGRPIWPSAQTKRIYLSTTQGGQFLQNSDLIREGGYPSCRVIFIFPVTCLITEYKNRISLTLFLGKFPKYFV
jgi:hypothetical protein